MYSFLWVVVLILFSSGSAGGSAGAGKVRGAPAAGLGPGVFATGTVGFGAGGPSVTAAPTGPSVRAAAAWASVRAVAGPGASVGFDTATFSKGAVGEAGVFAPSRAEELVEIWDCSSALCTSSA